ncbi:MAG: rubrerythrin family protein [Spartobacteria bacterium]|nr:rubrerythrin family protein [Spartobacteria bacterium]
MSRTSENLAAAFAGESQARNKYTYFAQVARQEGYDYIAKIFEETAENEKQHAMDHFKMLGGIGNTVENLKAAAAGEDYETVTMYPEFAAAAEAEGNKEAAQLFRAIAKVEEKHRERYLRLLALVENGAVFSREEPIKWKCSVCGHIHEGKTAPKICACCKNTQHVFEPAAMDL